MKKVVAITGSSGFLGTHLSSFLSESSSIAIFNISRKSQVGNTVECYGFDLSIPTDAGNLNWLEKVDTLVHCAARAHILNERAADPLAEYRTINTEGTLRLASAAAAKGVKRFIYISSIKVHGERNLDNFPITENVQLSPVDPYGISKFEAEIALMELATKTGMEVVIIRPPLIYGPGVKANFELLMRWLSKDRPIPFGNIKNRRSFVGIDNLCHFIKVCIDHPKAINETFLISDQDDVSTMELLRRLKIVMNSKSVILPLPTQLTKILSLVLGKGALTQRLFDNLFVSSNKASQLLGWKPPFTMEEQLQKSVNHFLKNMD